MPKPTRIRALTALIVGLSGTGIARANETGFDLSSDNIWPHGHRHSTFFHPFESTRIPLAATWFRGVAVHVQRGDRNQVQRGTGTVSVA